MTTRLADGKVHATVKRIEVTVALPADVAGPFLEELHEKLRLIALEAFQRTT
jgi:hypothetical protein